MTGWVKEGIGKRFKWIEEDLIRDSDGCIKKLKEHLSPSMTRIDVRISRIAAEKLIKNQIQLICLRFTYDNYSQGGESKFPYLGQYQMLEFLRDVEPESIEGKTDKEILSRQDIYWNVPLIVAVMARHGISCM